MSTPKSMRIAVGIFGRRNVGKSSIMNMLSNQSASIVSDVAGTTTDTVQKSIEIHGLGAATLFDTAGVDDAGELGEKRILKTNETIENIDIAVLVVENNEFSKFESELIDKFKSLNKPFLLLVNKCDLKETKGEFLNLINPFKFIKTSAKTKLGLELIYEGLAEISKQISKDSDDLFSGILNPGDIVLLITPIDDEAPKGRLILPQVQAIRQILDGKAYVCVSSDADVSKTAQMFKPNLIVCDSQCVLQVVKTAPKDAKITTFSILMSRLKGDLNEFIKGCKQATSLKDNDKILIAEACTHNAKDGDIARVKIPKMLSKFSGKKLEFSYTNGRDYPANLDEFALIVHCGGCMINKTMMKNRMQKASQAVVPITNYGIIISLCQGVLDRVTEIFRK
ncbi:hydrogenase maturation GTPase HydF [Campylobacter rectus RM3267]|uniref:[FeFe] hydrogenase H-cluster maturation GTPase HydF n=2 Tax=Campylobacter rectus TaxID=203 RepID=A0A6G5QN04_CAMRE|nr:[FeFe] hydrogenase H-cluster maturation GTPase HydF [Campylobacter rectus]EEF13312.1 hydrogenase maturation GTPase HydF [Campylobacter rectus RM3267]QCD47060.1 [FeFe] hydrogenase H-cluster maturation GTPase HydF [Campylobacter rectus]UEB47758.1 [FeFe] hydrogenase H-cluster maturation GTPase HydF [Campylobacter rectus]